MSAQGYENWLEQTMRNKMPFVSSETKCISAMHGHNHPSSLELTLWLWHNVKVEKIDNISGNTSKSLLLITHKSKQMFLLPRYTPPKNFTKISPQPFDTHEKWNLVELLTMQSPIPYRPQGIRGGFCRRVLLSASQLFRGFVVPHVYENVKKY